MSRSERALPVVSLGWLLALTAGLGFAAAAGVVTHSDETDAGTTDVLPAAAAGAVVALVIAVLVVRRLRRFAVLQSLGAPAVLVVLVACGALIGITTAADRANEPTVASDVTEDDGPTIGPERTPNLGRATGTPPSRERRDITDVQGTIILLGGLVLLVGAAGFLMRRSELRAVERNAVYLRSDLVLEEDEPESVPEDAALAEALGRSLDELLAESDPRLAIRAAYGSLLNELAHIGAARRPYEGPAEHIRRCLSAHPLPADSINELLHLFEIARFSEHPVTVVDADRARRVLTTAIDALAAAMT